MAILCSGCGTQLQRPPLHVRGPILCTACAEKRALATTGKSAPSPPIDDGEDLPTVDAPPPNPPPHAQSLGTAPTLPLARPSAATLSVPPPVKPTLPSIPPPAAAGLTPAVASPATAHSIPRPSSAPAGHAAAPPSPSRPASIAPQASIPRASSPPGSRAPVGARLPSVPPGARAPAAPSRPASIAPPNAPRPPVAVTPSRPPPAAAIAPQPATSASPPRPSASPPRPGAPAGRIPVPRPNDAPSARAAPSLDRRPAPGASRPSGDHETTAEYSNVATGDFEVLARESASGPAASRTTQPQPPRPGSSTRPPVRSPSQQSPAPPHAPTPGKAKRDEDETVETLATGDFEPFDPNAPRPKR